MTRIHATFDGRVLQPEEASALVPNKRYLLTIEDDISETAPSGKYPLARIVEMAQDLGITDLAERHDFYAGKR